MKTMKDHYDFSKGIRGKFYRGNEPFDVVIHVDHPEKSSHFEVFSGSDGKYHFRLTTEEKILFTSEEGFNSQDDCILAISQLKQQSLTAQTVFA
jgi:uncharacterized protein YegP (UPF0339 family)